MRALRGPPQLLLLLCLYSSCILAQNAADYEKALNLALRYANEREAQYNKELLDLVSIPSISTLSERAGDVRKAAEWLHARLRQAGLQQVEILETGAQPVVFAASEYQSGQPTVLIYGHYDVQPAAPESEWDTPPFTPVLKDGVFYGRGVDDDKGGLLQALQAVEAAVRTSESGLPPVNVKVVLEGQEEVGSPNLAAFLQQHKEKLACDLAFSADGGQISSQQGGIPIGLRGAVALEVTLTTSSSEHHSGVVGGSIQNAVHAMTQLLSTLRFANGSIAVDGFYEGVAEISQQDHLDEAAFPFDEAAEMESLGVQGFIGEEGFSTLQRRWLRPTVEVVGVSGGYTGTGIQNVVPKAATAKINSRLVAHQRPEEVLAKIQQHLHKHQPPYTNLTVTPFGFQAQPYVMPRDSPAAKLAGKVLEDVMGSPPLFYRGGGTIPAMALMRDALGVDMAMLAFGLPGDRIHAPNERFPLSMFDMGRRAYIQLLFEVQAQLGDPAVAALNGRPQTHDELAGRTIPALALLQDTLQVQAAVLAFGLPDDRIHGANERYPQRMYQLGRGAYIRLLFEAARARPEPEAAARVEL